MLEGFAEGASVDLEALVLRGLVRRRGAPVKLLGNGDAPKNLTVRVHAASASARQKIEAAGGSIEAIS
jgi:large subunit ribosomal protein L15